MSSDIPWLAPVKSNPIPWLLEEDTLPIRYRTQLDLLDQTADSPEMRGAQRAIVRARPVQRMLDAQWPEGYWMHPDVGYSPKHKATVWQIIFLAQVGLSVCEPIERAIEFTLAHSRLSGGKVPGTTVPEARFSAGKDSSTAIVCLNGNLLRALSWFGLADDPRVRATRAAMVAQIGRDRFRCRANGRTASGRRPKRMSDGLPCAWGAIKALSALLAVAPENRTAEEQVAIVEGVRFLLNHDPVKADFPTTGHVSSLWHKFGFPLGYSSDLVELLEVLLSAGVDPPRLLPAVELVLAKADGQGRWPLEHTPRNMWASFGRAGKPSKWVTLRVLKMLKLWRATPEGSRTD